MNTFENRQFYLKARLVDTLAIYSVCICVSRSHLICKMKLWLRVLQLILQFDTAMKAKIYFDPKPDSKSALAQDPNNSIP